MELTGLAQDCRLDPTTTSQPGTSPTKQPSSPLQPAMANTLKDYTIPPPPQPHFKTDSPLKRQAAFVSKAPPQGSIPGHVPFPQYAGIQQNDQENVHSTASLPGYRYEPPGMVYSDYNPYKRPMTDQPDDPAWSDRFKKPRLSNDMPFDLPGPQDMPAIYDDGTKPAHSYAELIGMAILRAPNRRLTLAQIYKWISDNYSFYKSTESGWQNSIRHNLSLNKNFIKQERPKDDPGKGNYWAIKPGEERPYLLGKKNPVRRITNPDGSQYLHGFNTDSTTFRPGAAPAIGHFSLAPSTSGHKRPRASSTVDSSKFPKETDLSSEGTIAASDPALQEDDRDSTSAMPPPVVHLPSSPPQVDIGSSPPQMPAQARRATPPPAPRFQSTSRSGNKRRKIAGLADSGYWSSLESSVARGAAAHLTSEADTHRRRIKKGRAEAEIARIRSSSFDSPIKERPQLGLVNTRLPSTSPGRDDQPLTPNVVFKRPPKPPASVSPNTNLRNHRDRMRALLGTPAKAFSLVEPTNSWSPAFNLAEEGSAGLTSFISPYKTSRTPWKPFDELTTQNNPFDIDVFVDMPEEDLASRGSPEKQAARPSLTRAASATGMLTDITGSARSNNITLAPPSNSPFSFTPYISKSEYLRSPVRFASPLKQSQLAPTSASPQNARSPGKVPIEAHSGTENLQPALPDIHEDPDLFGVHLPSDGSEEAIDIFQDFGKIGGNTLQYMPVPNRADGSPVKRSMAPPSARPRPTLNRYNTSRW